MPPAPSPPRCSGRKPASLPVSFRTTSAPRGNSGSRRTLTLAFLVGIAPVPAAAQSPLLEAALEKRAEVKRIRAALGAAPRYTDHDLAPGPHRLAPVEPRPPSAYGAETPSATESGAPPPAPGNSEAREAVLHQRLLDLEAALVSVGASGLPIAPRDPNRFHSVLDAARIRAEMRDVRRELTDLRADRP